MQRIDSAIGVPAGGIVDSDMQAEIPGLDTQLLQLVSGLQQMQRQLLIPEVIAEQFRQKGLTAFGQAQLQGALQIQVIVDILPLLAAMYGQQ